MRFQSLVSASLSRPRQSQLLACILCGLLGSLLAVWMRLGASPESPFGTAAAAEPAGTATPKAPVKPAAEKPAPKTVRRYSRRTNHDPNGLGKFYMGREIAQVMSFHGAPWLERPEREEEERLSTLVEALNLQPGQVVADIGAGSGVITIMMAREVGPTGKVYAVDIQQEMLDLLDNKLARLEIKHIEPVLGTVKSPKLPDASLDLAIMVDVYHEFEFPYEMMLSLSRAMKTGGRIAFVEYRREDPTVPIKLVHKMSQEQVKKEMSWPELHLAWTETIDELPRQHIVVFEKQATDTAADNGTEPIVEEPMADDEAAPQK